MYFLIDYENVNAAGLEGTEFLEKNDIVSIFYSEDSNTIQAYRMKDIDKSRCRFEICKLVRKSNNGIDFYIASKVGEIFSQDPNARIAIISRDKGFSALLDYWKMKLHKPNQLVRCKTIAKSISFVAGEKRRKKIVKEMMNVCYLEDEFNKYKRDIRIENKVKETFVTTEYEDLIYSIIGVINMSDCFKNLYLNTIKQFGRKRGNEIYKQIKQWIVFK